jgi:hypothetical protein
LTPLFLEGFNRAINLVILPHEYFTIYLPHRTELF